MDYTNLGLNNNMISIDSLQNKPNNFIDNYTLSSTFDVGAIDTKRVGNIFRGDIVSGSGNQTLTTDLVGVTGLTSSFTVDRESKVLVFGEARIEVQGAGGDAYFIVQLDNQSICQTQGVRFVATGDFDSKMTFDIITVAAGKHTINMSAWRSLLVTSTIVRDHSRIGYLILAN